MTKQIQSKAATVETVANVTGTKNKVNGRTEAKPRKKPKIRQKKSMPI